MGYPNFWVDTHIDFNEQNVFCWWNQLHPLRRHPAFTSSSPALISFFSPDRCLNHQRKQAGGCFCGCGVSGDSWMYPYQRTLMGNPYISPIYWVFMGYNPQESLENSTNTLGTLLGVHPIVPWALGFARWFVGASFYSQPFFQALNHSALADVMPPVAAMENHTGRLCVVSGMMKPNILSGNRSNRCYRVCCSCRGHYISNPNNAPL